MNDYDYDALDYLEGRCLGPDPDGDYSSDFEEFVASFEKTDAVLDETILSKQI